MIYNEITMIDLEQKKEFAVLFMETFNAAPWNESWTVKTAGLRLCQMMSSQDSYGFAAYEGDLLCGLILGACEQSYDGITFQVKEFCINNRHRGQGLGSKLFLELEDRLRKKGYEEMHLLTTRGHSTEDFYRKHGLQTSEESILMSKKLRETFEGK